MSTSASLPVPVEYAEVAAICTATEVMIGGQAVVGIADARDLHKGLKVRRDYATWITARIAKYGFREGEDYEKSQSPNLGTGNSGHTGGSPSLNYVLTLDMAKELAMVENNEQGRLIRRYFIWADNQLHARRTAGQSAQLPVPAGYADQLTAIRDENRKLYGALKKQQVEQANRVLDRLERMAAGLSAMDRIVRYSGRTDRDILNIIRDVLAPQAQPVVTAVKVDVNVPPAPAPDNGDRMLRLPEVIERVGMSKTTIYRLIQRGDFPAPMHPVQNLSIWKMSDLNEWMAAQR